MTPVVLHGFDDEDTLISFVVPVAGRTKPATIKIPRYDYIPEATADGMVAELERLDAEQQVIGAAHELVDAAPGADVQRPALLDAAKQQLTDLGVTVRRARKDGEKVDVLSAPTAKVVAALAPFAESPLLSVRRQRRAHCLAMLRNVVTDEEYGWLEALPIGALDVLQSQWEAQSATPLGESEASS